MGTTRHAWLKLVIDRMPEPLVNMGSLLIGSPSLVIRDRDDPPIDRILMDNCANVSTASSALAPNSLTPSEKPVRVSCNAGSVDLDREITYRGFNFKVNEDSQENVLS